MEGAPQQTARPSEEGSIRKGLVLAVQLVWDMGWIIAIPAVLFGFGGALLDKKLGTSPLFILLGLALALVLSAWGVWRKLQDILKKRF